VAGDDEHSAHGRAVPGIDGDRGRRGVQPFEYGGDERGAAELLLKIAPQVGPERGHRRGAQAMQGDGRQRRCCQ
jgi:hypothetical protein